MFLLSSLRVEDTPDASPPLPRRARCEDGGLHLPTAPLGFMSGEMGSHPREELLRHLALGVPEVERFHRQHVLVGRNMVPIG